MLQDMCRPVTPALGIKAMSREIRYQVNINTNDGAIDQPKKDRIRFATLLCSQFEKYLILYGNILNNNKNVRSRAEISRLFSSRDQCLTISLTILPCGSLTVCVKMKALGADRMHDIFQPINVR